MKNIILATVAASALASVAMAETPAATSSTSSIVTWNGEVAGMPNECAFGDNQNGTMEFDGGRNFRVVDPAIIKVSQRGSSVLTVESGTTVDRADGGADHGHNSYVAAVDYAKGNVKSKVLKSVGGTEDKVDITADSDMVTITSPADAWNVAATLEVAEGWKNLEIELGGKAKLLYNNHLIDNGDYKVVHTATCVQ